MNIIITDVIPMVDGITVVAKMGNQRYRFTNGWSTGLDAALEGCLLSVCCLKQSELFTGSVNNESGFYLTDAMERIIR